MIKAAVYDTKPYDREHLLKASGADEISWQFHEFRLTADTVASATGADVVCAFVNDVLDRPCLEALTELGVQLLALRCAGFNNVDTESARRLGLSVVRVPAYSPHAVAEHTVALLQTLNRKIHRAYNRVRELNFSLSGLVGFDLHGKTVGLIGTGKIGQLTAQIFRGFGMEVLVTDPQPDTAWSDSHGISYVSLEELLRRSDIVSLHAPLLPDTLHLLNETTLGQMKRGAIVVNTSRGKLIDTAALITALKDGRIGGVALDVYEEEEGVFFEDLSGEILADDELARLLTFPNVLITAHQAFLTKEALNEIARQTTRNILRLRDRTNFLEGTLL